VRVPGQEPVIRPFRATGRVRLDVTGLDALLELVAEGLPKPDVEVDLLLPYDRGDLLSRVHDHGEVLAMEHTEAGTRVRAKVHGQALASLAAYRV
jgi:GTP-binding protein HflX